MTIGKINQMRKGVRAKIHFLKIFLSLSTQALTNLTITKNTQFFDQMRKPKQ